MYSPTNKKAYLFTPQSTPVKRPQIHTRTPSGTPPIAGPDLQLQRRLSRKPSPPQPSPPEPLESEVERRLNHPVDFILHTIFQTVYQHVYLKLVAGERISPTLSIWTATTSLTIFILRLLTILSAVAHLAFWGAATTIKFTMGALIPTVAVFVRYIWTLVHGEIKQLCWQDHTISMDEESLESPVFDAPPVRRAESPASASLSPCARGRTYPPSPRSLRKPRRATPRSSPRPSMAPMCTDSMAWGSTTCARSCLGHRADDLQRILADCNEPQLEEAEKLVHGLQARARARAGWKV